MNAGALSSLPSGNEAFEIARDFIKPTWKSADSKFPDDEYKFVKNSDSVYVVTSYFNTNNNYGTAVKTNFTATLKYNGGTMSNQQNWTLVNLEEH